ncbi:MAG: HlyD family secretion protein [Christensenellales bacterium]|jgi:multidrug efflux pump subunit AcrA (membrane-fusion protein)
MGKAQGRTEETKVKKRMKRKIWPWALVLLAAAAGIFFIISTRIGQVGLSAIRSATAEKGSLLVTVVGTGNLEYDDSFEIEMPAGITVDEILVEKGDFVEMGDALAGIDPVSLKLQIDSVLSAIEGIDMQINAAKETPESEVVRASVSGRVKAIYGEKGDYALDVHFAQGALMLLSLDGKMAVDIVGPLGLGVGDKVDVTLENGSVKEGVVEGMGEGAFKVTLTDNGPALNENVIIHDKDGSEVSSGRLYINQPLRITAAHGKIKTVHVSLNDSVRVGASLFTLEDIPALPEYERLIQEREKQLDKLDALLEISITNTLNAKEAGVILSVIVQENNAVSSASPASSGSAASSAAYGSASAQAASSGAEETMTLAFTAAPAETMALMVNIDELDILSISEGMEVKVTFDAIGGREFSGEIRQISDFALAGGAVAKYPVKVLLERDESMREGMSATATITVEEKQDILLLPISAIQESNGQIYVYLSSDEETGTLKDETLVETGSSDGEMVEITSGLSQGDTAYYKVTSSELMNEAGFPFGGGGSPMRR